MSVCSVLFPLCSIKGQEQVQCKFYNELGRILVKGFTPVLQMDELLGEPEDEDDFPSFSHQDIGKLVFSTDWEGCGLFKRHQKYVEKSNLPKTAKNSLTHCGQQGPQPTAMQIQYLLEIQSTSLSKKNNSQQM